MYKSESLFWGRFGGHFSYLNVTAAFEPSMVDDKVIAQSTKAIVDVRSKISGEVKENVKKTYRKQVKRHQARKTGRSTTIQKDDKVLIFNARKFTVV